MPFISRMSGQPVAEEVDQLQVRIGQRAGGQIRPLERRELALLRLEARVAELQRRQFFGAVAVVADYFDLTEQRDAVERQQAAPCRPAGRDSQLVGADQAFRIGVRPDLDPRAAPARADLEAGAILGERIGALFVDEVDRDQELLAPPLRCNRRSGSLQIELVPVVRPVGTGVPLDIRSRCGCRTDRGLRQLPGEDFCACPQGRQRTAGSLAAVPGVP